jgi:hypothetical protein
MYCDNLLGSKPDWCDLIVEASPAYACFQEEAGTGSNMFEATAKCCAKYPDDETLNCPVIGESCAALLTANITEDTTSDEYTVLCQIYCHNLNGEKPEWCPQLPTSTLREGTGESAGNANAGRAAGIGGGAIAGIAIAVITVAVGIGVLVFFLVVKNKRPEAGTSHASKSAVEMACTDELVPDARGDELSPL